MKVKYSTNRETASVLKEMAGNLNADFKSLGTMAGVRDRLKAQRNRPVEDFMSGEADVSEPTGEAIMRAFQNCRSFRAKTIARLAPTIIVEAA